MMVEAKDGKVCQKCASHVSRQSSQGPAAGARISKTHNSCLVDKTAPRGGRYENAPRDKLQLDELQGLMNADTYATTYTRHFQGRSGAAATPVRPNSSNGYSATTKDQPSRSKTTYEQEFYGRDGGDTAGSVRRRSIMSMMDHDVRNNPHPLKTFMKCHMPALPDNHEKCRNMMHEIVGAVCRDTLCTTYNSDYEGCQQGSIGNNHTQTAQTAVGGRSLSDKMYRLEGTADHHKSLAQVTYQYPQQHPDIKGNTTRYGCNKGKCTAVDGIVPTVMRQKGSRRRHPTSYEEAFNGTAEEHTPTVAGIELCTQRRARKNDDSPSTLNKGMRSINAPVKSSGRHCSSSPPIIHHMNMKVEQRPTRTERDDRRPRTSPAKVRNHQNHRPNCKTAIGNKVDSNATQQIPLLTTSVQKPDSTLVPSIKKSHGLTPCWPTTHHAYDFVCHSRGKRHAENQRTASTLYPPPLQHLRADLNALQAGRKEMAEF